MDWGWLARAMRAENDGYLAGRYGPEVCPYAPGTKEYAAFQRGMAREEEGNAANSVGVVD